MTRSDSPRNTPRKTPASHGAAEGAEDQALETRLVALHLDSRTRERIRKLPKDMGWLLFSAGIMGLLVPGVIGTPFLVLGSLMIWPRSRVRAEKWLAGESPRAFRGSMKQINRFLDDLERRYPTA